MADGWRLKVKVEAKTLSATSV